MMGLRPMAMNSANADDDQDAGDIGDAPADDVGDGHAERGRQADEKRAGVGRTPFRRSRRTVVVGDLLPGRDREDQPGRRRCLLVGGQDIVTTIHSRYLSHRRRFHTALHTWG